jgi:hypothetical protein
MRRRSTESQGSQRMDRHREHKGLHEMGGISSQTHGSVPQRSPSGDRLSLLRAASVGADLQEDRLASCCMQPWMNSALSWAVTDNVLAPWDAAQAARFSQRRTKRHVHSAHCTGPTPYGLILRRHSPLHRGGSGENAMDIAIEGLSVRAAGTPVVGQGYGQRLASRSSSRDDQRFSLACDNGSLHFPIRSACIGLGRSVKED